MYRLSQIYKVKSKTGSYKTKDNNYYSFLKSDGCVIVFRIIKNNYGTVSLGKIWNLEPMIAKKHFKMLGKPIQPKPFQRLFEKNEFWNYSLGGKENIIMFPSKQMLIQRKIEREIEEMKNKQ